jgi:L-ascorbate metabolism protein UlaG (beta-lactamase superfamily)
MRRFFAALALLASFSLAPAPALAQAASDDGCLPHVADNIGPFRVMKASLKRDEVQITFIGHSTFLIESPKGVRISTDHNDYVKPRAIPDIATMNRAHNTHYTDNPDPRIKHVLKGWGERGGMAKHDLNFEDVRVRNVPTNIRSWGGGGTDYNGNSIFVYEISGMCIAHLGHLHHTLTPEHLKALGQIDIVLVPVDGSWTMDQDGMMEVLESLKAQLMIPMHYFGSSTLDRFLLRVGEKFDVARSDTAIITVSRATLPPKPKVLVLPGRHF